MSIALIMIKIRPCPRALFKLMAMINKRHYPIIHFISVRQPQYYQVQWWLNPTANLDAICEQIHSLYDVFEIELIKHPNTARLNEFKHSPALPSA